MVLVAPLLLPGLLGYVSDIIEELQEEDTDKW